MGRYLDIPPMPTDALTASQTLSSTSNQSLARRSVLDISTTQQCHNGLELGLLAMGYRNERSSRSYVGEYFSAHYDDADKYDDPWKIYQIEPRVFVAATREYQDAVELVNRLDRTGDYPWGDED